jgi:transcriptional regulator with XRE-family HTH domain
MQGTSSGAVQILGDRLREWRRSIPLKSYELAKLISISQGSLSDIENNKSLPSADTIAKIYLNTNINIIWLLIGRGAMKKEEGSSNGLAAPMAYEETEEYGQDPKLKELMEMLVRIYNQGDPEKKAHLVGFILGADPGKKTY